MMTSSNGTIFRYTGPLCGEFTGHRWIPLTKAVTRSSGVFIDLRLNKLLSKQSWGWWFETCNVAICAMPTDDKKLLIKCLYAIQNVEALEPCALCSGRWLPVSLILLITSWCHQMEPFSAILAICAGNSPDTGEFPSQRQWRGALVFSLICAWINGWVNNREAGDLRRAMSLFVQCQPTIRSSLLSACICHTECK